MNIKPLRNAALATGYIALVIFGISQFADGPAERNVPLLVPMLMLSLLTLSAAVMGYLFFYEPLKMYIDGEKKGAMQLFFQTLVIFAAITLALLAAVIVNSK